MPAAIRPFDRDTRGMPTLPPQFCAAPVRARRCITHPLALPSSPARPCVSALAPPQCECQSSASFIHCSRQSPSAIPDTARAACQAHPMPTRCTAGRLRGHGCGGEGSRGEEGTRGGELCFVLCSVLCSVLCALSSVLCALCSVLCPLCSVLCALYSDLIATIRPPNNSYLIVAYKTSIRNSCK